MLAIQILLLLGCSPAPEPCTEVGVSVGQCAPELSLPRADGSTWSLSEQRNRVVLVQFAASWCGICQQQAPAHQQLVDEYGGDGFIKATVLKGDENFEPAEQADAQAWKSYFELDHPVLYDEDKEAWKRWKRAVNSVPQMILVDGGGTIRWRRIGMASDEVLREQIEEHIRHLD